MKTVGNVTYCDIMMNSEGRSKGCGLVEYATAKQAAEAIEQLNDTELEGRNISVREDRENEGSIAEWCQQPLAGTCRYV